jgi:hypothetical protein
VHYFFSADSDNAASPEVLTEIDAQQWQFVVPTSAPTNVGRRYGNVIIAPLLTATIPLAALPTSIAPAAADGAAVTEQGAPVQAALAGTSLTTCDLTFSIVTPPAHGTLGAISDNPCGLGLPFSDTATVIYTPAPGFSGSDSFAYKVHDLLFDSTAATIAITVTAPAPPTCATGPVAGCRAPVTAGQAPLKVKKNSIDYRDRLNWKWTNGQATAEGDLGDPTTDTNYQLCLFDAAGRTIARASAPPGGDCIDRPCWTRSGATFTYRSRDRGLGSGPRSSVRLTLRPGSTGKAKIIAKVRGVHLGLSPLPTELPVTLQLKNSAGLCWEGVYSDPAQRNDARQLKDRAD